MMTSELALLKDAATRIRINSVKATCTSNSGHPTSCSSIAELMAVLFLNEMKYLPDDPRNPANDRFILSKGHAAPALYAAWAEVNAFPEAELLNLRKLSSDLEGHPTPRLSFIDVATGSLGQGLSNAVGMAYVGKYIDKSPYRVYCILGDGESAEGSVWEALAFASYYQLDNLVAILDVNRLGQSQATPLQHDLEVYRTRCEAFGCHAIVFDGHDLSAIKSAFVEARGIKEKPVVLVAKTFKGYDFPGISDIENWHGKPLGDKAETVLDHLATSLSYFGTESCSTLGQLKPSAPSFICEKLILIGNAMLPSAPNYIIGSKVATRSAYGTALARLGKLNNRIVGLDGDTKNSTFSIKLLEACPDQFIECFIAEQNMVGVGIGCSCRERTIPFVSTFAAFLSRAYDQIRMGAISQTNCNFVGSHAGVSIGEDGPSQMALEDLAMFTAVHGSTVFYPSDAVSTERAVELAANTHGICYIRTGRPADPVIYANDESFGIGQGKIVYTAGGTADQVTVIGAGVTLHEALAAANQLATENINIRVVDLFTVKPIDAKLVVDCVSATSGRVIVVEDHSAHGGLGAAVATVLSTAGLSHSMVHLAVRELPRSGKPHELLAKYGINAIAIGTAARLFLASA